MTTELTEAEFQDAVIDLARTLGWRVIHRPPSQVRPGRWVTNMRGDGVGFPDLELHHKAWGTRYWECKTSTGRTSPEQQIWLDFLQEIGFDARVIRPEHWADIVADLQGQRGQA